MDIIFSALNILCIFALLLSVLDKTLLEELLIKGKVCFALIALITALYNCFYGKYTSAFLTFLLFLIICFKKIRNFLCSDRTERRGKLNVIVVAVIIIVGICAHIVNAVALITGISRLLSQIVEAIF